MRKRHENGEQPEPPLEGGTACVVDLTPEAAVDEVSETEKLAAQLTEKDKEIAELKDKYLRTLADFENTRKRLRQQGDETARLQRENLLRGILPIVDNLERAIAAAKSSNGKSIVEGVEMSGRSSIHSDTRRWIRLNRRPIRRTPWSASSIAAI